jgi:NAD(P)-dependent dehydrogenase (short-subunit alcohol dehydrogenase family)
MQTGVGEHAAIVTGVSRGLGAALARELLEQGFTVLGIGRTNNAVLAGDRYRFAQIDLADAAAADTLLAPVFREIEARQPNSVCLLNNAATVDPIGVVGHLASAEISTALATNLTAPVTLANLFCRTFTDPEVSRRIINISSGAAEKALPGEAVYCVAKAGIEMLTAALAAEHAAPTFQAITLRPGVMDTDMQTVARSQPPEALPVVELFKGFHRDGRLVPAEVVASKIVSQLVVGEVDDSRIYTYQDL